MLNNDIYVRQHYSSLLFGGMAILIWVINIVVVKEILYELSLLFYLFLRFGFSFLILTVPLYKAIKKTFQSKAFYQTCVFLCCAALHIPLQALVIKMNSISWYIVFMSLSPLCAIIFLRALDKKVLLCGILGVTGVLCFIKFNEIKELLYFYQILFLILSLFTWSFLTLLIKKLNNIYSDVEITSIITFGGFLTAFACFSYQGFPFQEISFEPMAKILFLILGSIVAYLLFSLSIRKNYFIGFISQHLEFIFGILISYFWFKENHSLIQWGGCVLIFLSLCLMTNIKRNNPALRF